MSMNNQSVSVVGILSRSNKGTKYTELPIYSTRMEKRELMKKVHSFGNVLSVKGMLEHIKNNWKESVVKVAKLVKKSPVKTLLVTGLFTIALGFFANAASADCLQEEIYMVQHGDNIATVAANHGVTPDEILTVNNSKPFTEGTKILVPKVTDMKVVADALNVRSQPSTTSNIIGKLKSGNIAKVSSIDNGWAAILIDGRVCFVKAEYLQTATQTQSYSVTNSVTNHSALTVAAKKMYVSADVLRVRAAATTNSAVLGSVKQNQEIEVLSTNKEWSLISYQGKKAFVNAQYLSATKVTVQNNPVSVSSDINTFDVVATIAEVNPDGSFLFFREDGQEFGGKSSGNLTNELFNRQSKNQKVKLKLSGKRGQILTLISIQ